MPAAYVAAPTGVALAVADVFSAQAALPGSSVSNCRCSVATLPRGTVRPVAPACGVDSEAMPVCSPPELREVEMLSHAKCYACGAQRARVWGAAQSLACPPPRQAAAACTANAYTAMIAAEIGELEEMV